MGEPTAHLITNSVFFFTFYRFCFLDLTKAAKCHKLAEFAHKKFIDTQQELILMLAHGRYLNKNLRLSTDSINVVLIFLCSKYVICQHQIRIL